MKRNYIHQNTSVFKSARLINDWPWEQKVNLEGNGAWIAGKVTTSGLLLCRYETLIKESFQLTPCSALLVPVVLVTDADKSQTSQHTVLLTNWYLHSLLLFCILFCYSAFSAVILHFLVHCAFSAVILHSLLLFCFHFAAMNLRRRSGTILRWQTLWTHLVRTSF